MTLKETGFRALYKHFAAFPMTPQLKKAIERFPDADKADCVLVYGYIDHEKGLTLEVLAAGKSGEDGHTFFSPYYEIRSFVRAGLLENEDFIYFGDEDGRLRERYKYKIEALQCYSENEDLEQMREMDLFDGCRDKICIDDVLVYLTKDGLTPEGCWARLEGLGDSYYVGTLLNEPHQKFGWHEGETISFTLRRTDNGGVAFVSDMNPSHRYTAEELADGSVLEQAIAAFNSDRTQENFIDIVEILRDSNVWVPCNTILSERDQAMWDKAVIEAGDDPESLVGQEFVNQDPVRLVPDILQNGDDLFFPAFTRKEVMGAYGSGFSKVEHPFLDVIKLARNNENDLIGIVINAFTDPFVLDKELFDLVEKAKSSLE